MPEDYWVPLTLFLKGLSQGQVILSLVLESQGNICMSLGTQKPFTSLWNQ